jgi:hypothetical protein
MAAVAPDRFREVFDLAVARIEKRWGIPVRVKDVPNPFTGDLDGAEIHVDYDLEAEDALFILVHLFGHTVQWNVDPELRKLGELRGAGHSPETIAALTEYERQACEYSLQLLHELGVRDLDQWLADFAACDLAYLVHFYRNGDKPPFRSFWRDGQPLLEPLAIPVFEPTRWVTRYEGIVI